MTYSDSEEALASGAAPIFKCLVCGTAMRNTSERWECRAGSFISL